MQIQAVAVSLIFQLKECFGPCFLTLFHGSTLLFGTMLELLYLWCDASQLRKKCMKSARFHDPRIFLIFIM
jgi:hypothetical protein